MNIWVRNTLDWAEGRWAIAEKVSELEDIVLETMQNETEKDKGLKKNGVSLNYWH